MVNRYPFYVIFRYDASNDTIYPSFRVIINGIAFEANQPIPHGQSFGGLDLYSYRGRDIAGIWNSNTREIAIVGFF